MSSNATDIQTKMFLTRIGENSKIAMVILRKSICQQNQLGLNRSKEILGHIKEISTIDFDHNDVVRHT